MIPMQYKIPQDTGTAETFLNLGIIKMSLKQMIILFVGFGIGYLLYLSLFPLFGTYVALVPAGIVGIIALAFAFVRKDNMSFARMLLLLIEMRINPMARHWIPGGATLSPFDQILSMQGPAVVKKDTSKQDRKIEQIGSLVETLDHTNMTPILERVDEVGQRTAAQNSRVGLLEGFAQAAAKRISKHTQNGTTQP